MAPMSLPVTRFCVTVSLYSESPWQQVQVLKSIYCPFAVQIFFIIIIIDFCCGLTPGSLKPDMEGNMICTGIQTSLNCYAHHPCDMQGLELMSTEGTPFI